MRQRFFIILTSILLFGISTASAQFGPARPVKVAAQYDKGNIVLTLNVPEGYHAQSNKPLDDNFIKTEVKLAKQDLVVFDAIQYPAGQIQELPGLGKISVYPDNTKITIPIHLRAGISTRPANVEISGSVSYQICNEQSCLPPGSSKFNVSIPFDQIPVAAPVEPNPATQPATAPTTAPASSSSTPPGFPGAPEAGKTHSYFTLLGLAMLAGLIFNVMPCVLPVLPIKAIGFYEASEHDRGKTILFGAVFSLGLLAVFAALAMLVLLSRSIFGRQISWGQWFSYPAFVWGVVAILVLLGAGMLGAFTVNLPNGIYGLSFSHKTLGGNFMWGILTAALSTPCTAPLFPFVVGIAITLPVALGTLLIIMVGVGMALPYFLLSAFPEVARNFPRAGPVGELVKQMSGFLMFGTAAFFAGTKLPFDGASAWLVFGVALWASVFVVARTVQFAKSSNAILFTSAFAAILTGTTLWVALPAGGGTTNEAGVQFVDFSQKSLDEAINSNQPVLVKFTAKWCANCEVLEKTVYREKSVVDLLEKKKIVAMKLDVDKVGWDLHEKLAAGQGIPFTALFVPGKSDAFKLPSMHTTQGLIDFINSAIP